MNTDNASLDTDTPEKLNELDNYFKIFVTRNSGHLVSAQVVEEHVTEAPVVLQENPFAIISHNWFQLCLGLFEAFPIFGSTTQLLHMHKVETNLVGHLEKIAHTTIDGPEDETSTTTRTYLVDKQYSHRVFSEITRLNQYKRAQKAISRAQLLALMAEYEAVIGDLLRAAIQDRPEAFIPKDSTVSAIEIIGGGSIDAIRDSIIEDRIESIQRESNVDQILLIFDKLKLNHPDDQSIKDFAEICERRNMLTHTNGKVSKSYHAKLKKVGIKADTLPPIGEELRIDSHYMRRSVARVFMMGYFTLHIVWQHLRPKEQDISVKILINDAHEFLRAGYTKMAERVCDFILNKKSPATELDRAYAIINKSLSYHLNDELPEADRKMLVEKTLSMRDWSMVDAKFSLALCRLREQYDDIPKLFDSCVRDGLTVDAFLRWALFKNARKNPAFLSKMKEHFGIEPNAANSSLRRVKKGSRKEIGASKTE